MLKPQQVNFKFEKFSCLWKVTEGWWNHLNLLLLHKQSHHCFVCGAAILKFYAHTYRGRKFCACKKKNHVFGTCKMCTFYWDLLEQPVVQQNKNMLHYCRLTIYELLIGFSNNQMGICHAHVGVAWRQQQLHHIAEWIKWLIMVNEIFSINNFLWWNFQFTAACHVFAL